MGIRCFGVVLTEAARLCASSARLRIDASDVYTWGEGKLARLGHGEESDEYAPRVLEALLGHDVVQVAAGTAHTIAVTGMAACPDRYVLARLLAKPDKNHAS